MVRVRRLIDRLTPQATDDQVAKLVVLYLLEADRQPYWFSIDHDIRPPKMLACPVDFDWAKKDRVGIKTSIKTRAGAWIKRAALAGYSVTRDNGEPLTMSIKRARQQAYYAQMPDDEDIPF